VLKFGDSILTVIPEVAVRMRRGGRSRIIVGNILEARSDSLIQNFQSRGIRICTIGKVLVGVQNRALIP